MTALALLQQLPEFRTPDTSGYLALGYTAILGTLAAYAVALWIRGRRAGKDPHAS